MDRLILLRPPRGGILGITDVNFAIATTTPIYGFRDAGRLFWKGFRRDILSAGLKENRQFRALYTYEVDGDVKVMLGTHVDDVLYACKPGFEYLLDPIFKSYDVKKMNFVSVDVRFDRTPNAILL